MSLVCSICNGFGKYRVVVDCGRFTHRLYYCEIHKPESFELQEMDEKQHDNGKVLLSTEKVMKTKCGKRVHLIGIGVCGQEVYQVQENNAPIQDHSGWRICRLEDGKLISFGKSGIVYELDSTKNDIMQQLKAHADNCDNPDGCCIYGFLEDTKNEVNSPQPQSSNEIRLTNARDRNENEGDRGQRSGDIHSQNKELLDKDYEVKEYNNIQKSLRKLGYRKGQLNEGDKDGV